MPSPRSERQGPERLLGKYQYRTGGRISAFFEASGELQPGMDASLNIAQCTMRSVRSVCRFSGQAGKACRALAYHSVDKSSQRNPFSVQRRDQRPPRTPRALGVTVPNANSGNPCLRLRAPHNCATARTASYSGNSKRCKRALLLPALSIGLALWTWKTVADC